MDAGIIKIIVFGLGLLFGCWILFVGLVTALKGKKLEAGNAAFTALGVVLLGMSIWTTIKIEVPGGIIVELTQTIEANEKELDSIKADREAIAKQLQNVERIIGQIRPNDAQPEVLLSLRTGISEINTINAQTAKKIKQLDVNSITARVGLDKLRKSARLLPSKDK